MATRLQIITELSENTAKDIIRDTASWTSFLKTAAWNYKYPFQDEVLIYAQRPDATACAPIELWNKKLDRWVNKGAKGIALIDFIGNNCTLRHVFDISDTHSHGNRPISLWTMRDEYKDIVTEALGNAFGELDCTVDLSSSLACAAYNAADDNLTDYLPELFSSRAGSLLESMNEQEAGELFKYTLKSSVAYMVLTRCGCNAEEYVIHDDLQKVSYFNTTDTISHLGAAVSDISEMVLRQIEVTVKDLQRTERNRTIAKDQSTEQNKAEDQNERNDEHGTDVYAEGRLPRTRPYTAGGRDPDRQVWDVAQNISEKPQERIVHEPYAFGQPYEPSGGDRPDSEGAHRHPYGAASKEEPGTRQGDRPDGLGGVQ